MERTISISKDKYYKAMLNVMSRLINLTKFEIELISTMFSHNIKILNKVTRLDLRLLLDTSEYNLNNYIKKLKAKKVLLQTEDGLELNQTIKEAVEDKSITINFNTN